MVRAPMPSRLRRLVPWIGIALAVLLAAAWIGAPELEAQPAAPAAAAPAPADAAPASADPDVPDACLHPPEKKAKKPGKPLLEKLAPIALLLIVIAFVVARLPRVDLGHSAAFRRRRLLNWLPLGLTYSFLYMGRYNINQFMYVGGITEREFGQILAYGSAVYGLSFLLNGPLADIWGGRATILISALGSALCNAAMGYMLLTGQDFGDRAGTLTVLYAANM